MRTGIIGGTFNPPHIGHMNAARAAKEELSLSRLIFIPSYLPPHKQMAENSATPGQRLDMARCVAELLGAEVSDMEIVRGGTSYTVDTLRMLKEKYPDDELWFIMGTDMFLTIESWREPESIFRLAGIAVMPRSDGDVEKLLAHSRALGEKYGAVTKVMEHKAIEISSTELRDGISDGRLSEFLPETVYKYISDNGLYGI